MKIYPYHAGHLDNLLLQPAQQYLQTWYEDGGGKMYDGTYAFSLIDDGVTLACAGLQEIWTGRAQAWAILSADIGRAGMMMAVRAINREFEISRYDRVEAYVDASFEHGNRLAELLGFVNETPNGMKNFLNGKTHNLWAR